MRGFLWESTFKLRKVNFFDSQDRRFQRGYCDPKPELCMSVLRVFLLKWEWLGLETWWEGGCSFPNASRILHLKPMLEECWGYSVKCSWRQKNAPVEAAENSELLTGCLQMPVSIGVSGDPWAPSFMPQFIFDSHSLSQRTRQGCSWKRCLRFSPSSHFEVALLGSAQCRDGCTETFLVSKICWGLEGQEEKYGKQRVLALPLNPGTEGEEPDGALPFCTALAALDCNVVRAGWIFREILWCQVQGSVEWGNLYPTHPQYNKRPNSVLTRASLPGSKSMFQGMEGPSQGKAGGVREVFWFYLQRQHFLRIAIWETTLPFLLRCHQKLILKLFWPKLLKSGHVTSTFSEESCNSKCLTS